MFIASMLGGGLLGVGIERFAYRRLRDAPRIAPLITALGVSFFLENARAAAARRRLPELRHVLVERRRALEQRLHAARRGVHVALAQIIVVVGAIVLMCVLTYFVARTQLGRAMRATSFDRQAAEMMGIDVNRVIASTFFIGSALAGAAGIFNCLVYQQVWPYMGFDAGLKAFTAAVVGGIGSLPGAVVGGLVDRADRGVRDRLRLVHVPGRDRVRDPDRDDDPAPERPLRARRGEQGLMTADDTPTPEPEPGKPRIGVDEWVASHEGRREGARGRRRPRPRAVRADRRTRPLRRVRRRRGDACRSGRTTTT